MRGLHLRKPGNTLSHTDTMKTLNSEPRITLNWVPGAWAGYGYTGAPTLKADAFNLAMAMAELRSVAAERDKLSAERSKLKIERDSANWSLSRAKESLRAAEADVAETESVNSDLRTVNARLVADLAAAMERADTAEAILRAKA